MATTSPNLNKQASIPFWRDVRVLGVIGQLIALFLILAGAAWLVSNFLENAANQGLKVGFDFLNTTAAFDISEGIEYEATDTFGRALWVAIVNTLKVSILGIILTTILGTITGIARLSNNWLINRIATVYIEIVRNVPLLVLLFFLYFAVILKLPPVNESIQPFGLPIYLNQRGVTIPGLTATIGFPVWLAFVVLAIILVMLFWVIQNRKEEKTGDPANKFGLSVLLLFIVILGGWLVTQTLISDQAIMVASSRNIAEFEDFEPILLLQLDKDALSELGVNKVTIDSLNSINALADYKDKLNDQIASLVASGENTDALTGQLDILNEPAITVCAVSGTAGEVNTASQLRRQYIPVKVSSEDNIQEAGEKYADGDCDLLAGTYSQLASERAVMEDAAAHDIVGTPIAPLVLNIPAPAGFNIQGGIRLTPEFAALLAGLVIYTSAFAAEIVRAGILAVSKGQSEAARALGLSESQRLRLVVLPQAARVIIPPMTSQYLNLTKNSSLAVAIGYPDLVAVGNTVLNQSGFAVQVILVFMVTYLTISLSISAFLNWYNKKVALVER